jgi:hypothetical protein
MLQVSASDETPSRERAKGQKFSQAERTTAPPNSSIADTGERLPSARDPGVGASTAQTSSRDVRRPPTLEGRTLTAMRVGAKRRGAADGG